MVRMARIFSRIFENQAADKLPLALYPKYTTPATSERLGVGYHYHKEIDSIIVEPGEVVILYDDQERREGRWQSWQLYEGTYHALGFYGAPNVMKGCVHVAETALTADELTEVGWWSTWISENAKRYRIFVKLPPGDWVGKNGVHFPNDRMDHLDIPFGFQAEVFRELDFSGGSLIFNGDEATVEERDGERVVVDAAPRHVELLDYGWNGRVVSAIRITSEDWVDAGIEIEQSSVETDEESSFAGTITLSDNVGDDVIDPKTGERVEVTLSQTVTKETSDSMEENWGTTEGEVSTKGWNVSGSIEQGIGVTGKAGPVEIESQTKVSVTAGGHGEQTLEFNSSQGGSQVRSSSQSLSAQVSLVSKRQGRYKGSAFIDYGIITGVAVRKIRNKRTGVTVEKRCPFRRKKGFSVAAEINGQRIRSEPVSA